MPTVNRPHGMRALRADTDRDLKKLRSFPYHFPWSLSHSNPKNNNFSGHFLSDHRKLSRVAAWGETRPPG